MRARGFTLVEMVLAITILGIIAAIAAVFLRSPAQAYVDTARRAWMTDAADTALRRMARDVQRALPNSLRPTASCSGNCAFELLLTDTGGRYRHDDACFSTGCGQLKTLGNVIGANGEHVGRRLVIYNLHANEGGSCPAGNPSAWCGQNTATIIGSTEGGNEDVFTFASTTFSPGTGSPARAFFIVSGPVAYVCSGVGTSNGNGTGELRRYEGYAITPASTLPPPGVTGRLLAHRVSACRMAYRPTAVGTVGLLDLYLELTEAGETIGLHHQVHVDNAP